MIYKISGIATMMKMKINNIALDQLIDELKQQGLDNEQIYYHINEMLNEEQENDIRTN